MKSTLLFFAKLHIVLLFLLIFKSSIAQNCGVGDEFHAELSQQNTNSRTTSISPVNGILYIPITIHQVRHTDGTYSKNNSLEPFYHSLVSLNRVFLQVHIQFYVNKNIDYIDNNAYLYPTLNGVENQQLRTNYKNANTANVWILDGWSDATTIAGYAGPGGVELAELTERTVIHEFGHFFTLMHTFDFVNGVEKVARTGGNCATAGDGLCDTQADPYGLSASQVTGNVLTYANCEVTSNTKDLSNAVYTPPFDNFMSYYDNACGLTFTPQQFDRMVASIPVYHSGYNEMQGAGIAGAPSALNILSSVGYAEISWTNSAGSIGTLIEYSKDGGTTWEVMNGVTNNQTKLLLSNVFVGINYSFRARHLNSIAYSAIITHSPTYAHAFVPLTNYAASTSLPSIGGVQVLNTTLNNQTNLQDLYSFNPSAQTPVFFIGSTYTLNLTLGSNNNFYSAGYFFIYIDENKDGDFDDAGELKYKEQQTTYPLSLSIPLAISSQAAIGYSRMRVRVFGQNKNFSPTNMYNYSETEDYLIQFVTDVAPTSIATVYNQSNKTIELTWADNTNNYNYVIERSIDGVNFLPVKTTIVSTPKLYVDTDIALGQKYYYRIKHLNGVVYSSVAERLVIDVAPTSVAGVYSQSNKTIQLTWADNTNNYNYVIERSIDGINFSTVNTTTVSTPKLYVDTDVLSSQEYSYRIKHVTGTIYSSIADVMTTVVNSELTYCSPVSSSGCATFELSEFAIPSIGFVNNTAGNCGLTSDGYSDFYPTKTINLTAGSSYAYTMKNNRGTWYDFNMYLDVNQNGIFESSEALVNFHTASTNTPYDAGPFVVSASAMNGYTRLRLRNYIFTQSDPCIEAVFGETEDYKVLISGGKEDIIINPMITNVTANQITLSWSPQAATSPAGYKLKISTDGVTYSGAITLTSSQTSYTYTGLLSNQRYFIQVVTAGTIASDPKTVWTQTLPITTAIVDEVIGKNTAYVYPNPVSGILTIKANGLASLVNGYGQVMKSEAISEASYWDMNGFASGIYFLYIQNEDQTQILKIIKQ